MKQHYYLKGILLCLCLFTGINTFAYDAEIDGIYYKFSGNEAEVTYQRYESSYPYYISDYSGAVAIPSSVSYNNKTYSVTSIGWGAFYNCSGLTSVTIPNSVTSIGYRAFSDCISLTSVTIPEGVTSIGGYAFYNCSSLASINIPNSVTSIGYEAFSDCTSLTSVNIPNSVTKIFNYVFRGCSSLISVIIGNGVTSIGNSAFENCSSLTSIVVDPENTTYDSRNDCNAIIETASNTLIAGCQNTIIPNSVTSIGDYAFYNCTGLTSITIPNSVTSIGEGAFQDCYGLTSVTIPEGVTSIGGYAFSGCSSLSSVKVDIETPLTITSNTFSNRANATLIVPIGCKPAYEAADYWNEFSEILEMKDDITIGSTGFATYCSEHDLDFSGVSGMKAYIASGFSPSTGKLVLTRVTEVPAGEGLYLVGDAGTYEVPFTETDMIYSNLLRGVTTATTISPTDGSYTNFILANGEHGVAFYSLSEAGELAAGKAYLQLPTASVSEVKAIRVIFDDDEDAIQSIAEESQTERIYNLQGQQVNAPKSGLYIVNGKKVFIK